MISVKWRISGTRTCFHSPPELITDNLPAILRASRLFSRYLERVQLHPESQAIRRTYVTHPDRIPVAESVIYDEIGCAQKTPESRTSDVVSILV